MHKQQSLFPELGLSSKSLRRAKVVSPERLPTNTTTSGHPVHRWFNFIAGFSPEFVALTLGEVTGNYDQGLVLDPFAGCGTALVVAADREIHSVGYEAHPVFEKICRAKLPGPDASEHLAAVEDAIVVGLERPEPLTALQDTPTKFLIKLFPVKVLCEMLGARRELKARELDDDPLAFLVLSKILDLSSHSATDGIYKAPTTKKRSFSPHEAVSATCEMVRTDLAVLNRRDFASKARVFGKSSETMTELADKSVSIVVTSPPYLNNFDYAEMTRMYLYFWGLASSWGEITEKVRSRLIVNTTTALRGHKENQERYRDEIPTPVRPQLDAMVCVLAGRRRVKAGKKEYNLLVYPYFSQIARVFRECHRVLAVGGPIHVMVADSALYGIHVRTPQILASILSELDFRNIRCELVRNRGHRWILEKREGTIGGLGEYHIHASR